MNGERQDTIVEVAGGGVEIAGRRPTWRRGDDGPSIWPSVTVRRTDNAVIIDSDPLGSTPVYIAEADDRWIIGSSMVAVCRAFDRAEIDSRVVTRRLSVWWCRPEETLFRGVRRLPPGTRLRAESGEAVDIIDNGNGGRCAGLAETKTTDHLVGLRKNLERQIDHLVATVDDIHVGLSGGVDSSALTAAFASRGRRPVVWLLDDGCQCDEEVRHRRRIIEQFELSAHRVTIDAASLPDHFEDAVLHMQGAVINARAVAKYRFFRRVAASKPAVFATGVGADDLFAGTPNAWTTTPDGVPKFAASGAEARSVGRSTLRKAFQRSSWRAPTGHGDFWELRRRRIDSVTRQLVFPMEIAVPASLGIRPAAPFMSPSMIELARGLERRDLIAGDRGKRTLRRAVEPWVGRATAWQPKRPVYAPPGGGNEATRRRWTQCFAGVLTRSRLRPLECVCPKSVRNLIDEYRRLDLSSTRIGSVERVLMHLASLVILTEAGR